MSAPTQQPKAETQSEQKVEKPKIYKTYLDFKDSLSESERENFFSFVKEETKNLEKKINDLEAWLASKNAAKQNRWEIYYRNYQKESFIKKAGTNKQNQGSAGLTPSQTQRAIAEFKKRMNRDLPVDEPQPRKINNKKFNQRSHKPKINPTDSINE